MEGVGANEKGSWNLLDPGSSPQKKDDHTRPNAAIGNLSNDLFRLGLHDKLSRQPSQESRKSARGVTGSSARNASLGHQLSMKRKSGDASSHEEISEHSQSVVTPTVSGAPLLCRECSQPIQGEVLRANKVTYHLACFRCHVRPRKN